MRQRSVEKLGLDKPTTINGMISLELEFPARDGKAGERSLTQTYGRLGLILFILLMIVVISFSNTYDYKTNQILEGIQKGNLKTMEAHDAYNKKVLTISSNLRLDSLKIFSMNIAQCQSSANAPSSWTEKNTTSAIQEEVLKHDPDVLMLQECPSPEWAKETFAESHRVMGATSSHAGYVTPLIRHALALYTQTVWPSESEDKSLWSWSDRPFVMVKVHLDQRSLMIASCHLAYSEEGAIQREKQIADMLLKAETSPLILAGDTNMRETEDDSIEQSYQLEDAWKLAGANPATRFTWDTLNHESEGGFFNQYYGWRTRKYTKRYDRIYISNKHQNDGTSGEQKNITVESFELIANKPVSADSTRHFLSDHFGIACKLRIP